MSSNQSLVDHPIGFDLSTKPFRQLIAGELVSGASTVEVIDPGSGSVIATAPVADVRQIDQAVSAARRALPAWRTLPFDERRSVVNRIADALAENSEVLARITTLEQGKPLAQARNDVQWAIDFARHFANSRLDAEVIEDSADAYVEIRRTPVGVIGAIAPWNFPLFQAVYKIAPALALGNTMVLKPSPTTPLGTLYLAELVAEHVPAGVLNIIGDSGEVGRVLTAHPGIDKVSFTGSTATGRAVMASAAPGLKRLTLELGGNDAAIVLDDVNIEETAQGIFDSSFNNAGQACVAIKRIYAPESIYDALTDEIARIATATRVGHGLDPATQMGPVQNPRQFSAAQKYLRYAAEHGTIVAGGSIIDRPGYFVEPTVVRDIAEDSPLITDETFGPVRSILRYDNIADAIGRANASQYGLGSSVWSTDIDRATAVAGQLEAGTTWVNQHLVLSPLVPFGGVKQSGVGVEFGRSGLEEMTNVHVVNIRRR